MTRLVRPLEWTGVIIHLLILAGEPVHCRWYLLPLVVAVCPVCVENETILEAAVLVATATATSIEATARGDAAKAEAEMPRYPEKTAAVVAAVA